MRSLSLKNSAMACLWSPNLKTDLGERLSPFIETLRVASDARAISLKPKGVLVMLSVAIALHSLQNFLAIYKIRFQGIPSWFLLLVVYFSKGIVINEIKR